MNRNGEKPESLKNDAEPVAPEFVTAVGDDAINRFDEARKRKRKKKSRSGNDTQKKEVQNKESQNKEPQKKERKAGGQKGGHRNNNGKR